MSSADQSPSPADASADRALVVRCVAGDARARDELVTRFGRLVYATITRTLTRHDRQPDEATLADLFGGAFVALVEDDARRLRQWDGRCSLASWIRLVAASTTLDVIRAERRRERGRTHGVEVEHLPLDGQDALDRALLAERLVQLERALEVLAPPDRELLELIFRSELAPAEVATRLGIAPGALYTRKNRALERLRKAFHGGDAEGL